MKLRASVTTYKMRTLLSALVLAAPTAPALAQAPSPTPCAVTIVRAPEQVRATVEQWLAKESCTVALSVRIVPTEGGLYLLATDEHGRVRERIVPDASSAGVLIASWAADDGLGGAATPRVTPVQPYAPPPVAPDAAPTAQFPYRAGAAPVTAFGPGDFHPNAHADKDKEDDDDEEIVSPKQTFPQRYMSIGGGVGPKGTSGARLQIDIANWGNWTLGVVGSVTASQAGAGDYNYSTGSYTSYSAQIVDYVAGLDFGHIWHFGGGWHIRGEVGAGLAFSTMDLTANAYDTSTSTFGSGSMTSPYVETSLMIGHSFGEHDQWALELGTLLSYTRQDWYIEQQMATMTRDGGNMLFLAGLRHGL